MAITQVSFWIVYRYICASKQKLGECPHIYFSNTIYKSYDKINCLFKVPPLIALPAEGWGLWEVFNTWLLRAAGSLVQSQEHGAVCPDAASARRSPCFLFP